MHATKWIGALLTALLLTTGAYAQEVQVDHNPAFESLEDERSHIVEPPPTPEPVEAEFRGSAVFRGSIVGLSPTQKLTLVAPEPGSNSAVRKQWDLPVSESRTFGKMSMADGRYLLRIVDEAGKLPPEEYQLGFLGVLEFQTNVNERVRVGGSVAINGRPVPNDRVRLGLMPKGDVQVIVRLLPTEGNTVQAFVSPGEYELVVFHELFGMTRTGLDYRIGAQPKTQRLALDLPASDVQVQIQLPPGASDQSGDLVFDFMTPLSLEERRIPYIGQAIHLADIYPGSYFFGFETPSGLMAHVALTDLQPGQTRTMTLLPTDHPPKNYELTIQLPPGSYQYKLYLPPNSWFIDPLNPEAGTQGGVANSVFRVPGGANNPDGSRAKYPAVNDQTNEVTFRYESPTPGAKPYVRGSFNHWNIEQKWRLRAAD
ncbi:hypothetical protein KQI84_17235 [bacterium]|nr:hypothetical protein [bacterium]